MAAGGTAALSAKDAGRNRPHRLVAVAFPASFAVGAPEWPALR